MIKLLCAIIAIFIFVLALSFMYAAAPRTPEERNAADREQLEYIKKWCKEHNKEQIT